jgi:ATP-dependent Lhr-like helicase
VAVESVRAMRRVDSSQATVTLSAADPLNLVGILLPGDRVPAISGNSVTYRTGAAVGLSALAASAGNQAAAS